MKSVISFWDELRKASIIITPQRPKVLYPLFRFFSFAFLILLFIFFAPFIIVAKCLGISKKANGLEKVKKTAYELALAGKEDDAFSILEDVRSKLVMDSSKGVRQKIIIEPYGLFKVMADSVTLLEHMYKVYASYERWDRADSVCGEIVDRLFTSDNNETHLFEMQLINKAKCLYHLKGKEEALKFLSGYTFSGPNRNIVSSFVAELQSI